MHYTQIQHLNNHSASSHYPDTIAQDGEGGRLCPIDWGQNIDSVLPDMRVTSNPDRVVECPLFGGTDCKCRKVSLHRHEGAAAGQLDHLDRLSMEGVNHVVMRVGRLHNLGSTLSQNTNVFQGGPRESGDDIRPASVENSMRKVPQVRVGGTINGVRMMFSVVAVLGLAFSLAVEAVRVVCYSA